MKKQILLFVVVSLMFADIPSLINYQGKLTSSVGIGVTSTEPVTFRIYDTETGGASLWSETHPAVTIEKGLFAVELGSISPLTLGFDTQYWLEIEIDGDILSPRQNISAEAYAIRAAIADSIAGGTGWTLTNEIGEGTDDMVLKPVEDTASLQMAMSATAMPAPHT